MSPTYVDAKDPVREQASEISLGLTDHPSDRTLPPVVLAFVICAILACWMLA